MITWPATAWVALPLLMALATQYYQTYGPFGFNANLKWEQTATTNAGLDYSFANGRINGSVDIYLKKTKDLLNSVPQPTGTNFSPYILANVGSMENKGVEINLNLQPVRNRDLNWDVNFNLTYNKNTITNLTVIPNDPTYIGVLTGGAAAVNGFVQVHAVGGPKNTFYLFHQVYDAKGNPIEGLFEDLNRDGIINEKDKYKGHTADPNLFMGFSTNLAYKKWNGGFVMRSNLNNYVYNNIYSNRGRLNQVLGNYTLGNASSQLPQNKLYGQRRCAAFERLLFGKWFLPENGQPDPGLQFWKVAGKQGYPAGQTLWCKMYL